jgi:hypothetical protein
MGYSKKKESEEEADNTDKSREKRGGWGGLHGSDTYTWVA